MDVGFIGCLVLGVVILGGVPCALALRPWMLRWGSTAEERTRPLPDDDLSPDAGYVTTRAVAIIAPTEAVWPWLIQMGQDRAGF